MTDYNRTGLRSLFMPARDVITAVNDGRQTVRRSAQSPPLVVSNDKAMWWTLLFATVSAIYRDVLPWNWTIDQTSFESLSKRHQWVPSMDLSLMLQAFGNISVLDKASYVHTVTFPRRPNLEWATRSQSVLSDMSICYLLIIRLICVQMRWHTTFE